MHGRSLRARAIAFYLPQFHPIPENDKWWGPGFTEWTNVTAARPLFRGHRQPVLPGALGYYDLRVPEVRAAQAELAQQFGVEAFCYWHYWFAGRTILERPLAEVVKTGEPNLPFCVAWANQSWTGAWHGAHDRILLEQTYPGAEDDRAHFDYLRPMFEDDRYLTVDGRPLFYVFRPEQLPDPTAFVERWRTMAQQAGFGDLYLVAEVSDLLGRGPTMPHPQEWGFDAGVYLRLPADVTPRNMLRMRARRKLLRWPEVYPVAQELATPPVGWDTDDVLVGVYPNWDNTPRAARRGLVIQATSPETFGAHVRAAITRLATRPEQERLLFIKSWNEWAEGNHLEPDREVGTGYLEALRRELERP